ncbi:MAG TPA: RagB/SusD family nutrient uptake outer membrane protein [Longimicrobiaceae bacterium]
MINRKSIIPLGLCLSTMLAACESLSTEPSTGMASETALGTLEGIEAATRGNYRRLIDHGLDWHRLAEFPSDEVMLCCTTSSALYNLYTYIHAPNLSNVRGIWRGLYQAIYGTNQVIERLEPGTSPETDQLLGENIFLRAYFHFYLVNAFGRPYVQGRDNPGVPIVTGTDPDERPARATVGEVYDFVVAELERAAELMTIAKPNGFATREAAWALLSRVHLYRGENEQTIEYATRVIESGRFQLADMETYKAWPTMPPESNPELIFAIKHTQADNRGSSNVGYLYYRSPDGVGYGEMYMALPLYEKLMEHPEDARLAFIDPQYERDADGNIVTDEEGRPVIQTRNGVPMIYVIKYVGQEGIVTLSSPVVLRLAEMYLNRAEANAKLGNDAAALEDVNRIRQRAGLSGDGLYSIGDLKGHDSVLDVVLEERHLELAFEGHRTYDLFRNGRPVVRTYPGSHLTPIAPGVNVEAGTQLIPPDHPRIVYFLPEDELELNSNLEQNP